MEPGLFPKIASSPALIWLLPAIGFYITNLFVGIFMAFQKKTPTILRIHSFLHYGIVTCLFFFLLLNQTHGENTLWDYLVFLYLIIVPRISKSWDVLIHSFLSLIGFTLIPLLIILQI